MSAASLSSLRERIGVDIATDVADGLGGQIRSWARWSDVWARIEPLDLRTDPESGRTLRRYRAAVRYRPDFPSTARVQWRDTTLFVRAVSDPDIRGERLHLILEDA